MQDQKMMTLLRRSFLQGSSFLVTTIVLNKGGQYFDYQITPLHSRSIIQDARPKMLTLRWCSFLAASGDFLTSIFALEGGQYWDYVLMPVHSQVIIQDARPKIVDAPLMLISRLGQRTCRLPFNLSRRPIRPLWMDTTMQPFNCGMGNTINHWRYIDDHLRDILTVIGCSTIVHTMHTVVIDSQYIIAMYNHLHPKSFETSQFVSRHYSHHLNEKWRTPIAFQHFRPAIYYIKIHPLIIDIDSPTITRMFIQLILLDFHDVP